MEELSSWIACALNSSGGLKKKGKKKALTGLFPRSEQSGLGSDLRSGQATSAPVTVTNNGAAQLPRVTQGTPCRSPTDHKSGVPRCWSCSSLADPTFCNRTSLPNVRQTLTFLKTSFTRKNRCFQSSSQSSLSN